MFVLDTFPGIETEVPLAPYTHFKIGGPARYLYRLQHIEDASALLQAAAKDHLPVLVLGGGSNILISDKGFPGLVILNQTQRIQINGTTVIADSGVKLSQLITETVHAGLTGLEYMVGIPGTVGGAVRGNAGIPGWEMKDFVIEGNILDLNGNIQKIQKEDFQFGYRDSILKKNGCMLLSVTLRLQNGDKEECQERMRDIQQTRLVKQPQGKSCGSFFKNPSKEQPAGLLIDQAGLKGYQIGGAKVSEIHANFLMNTGTATFDDFMQLVSHIKKTVFERFHIMLEEEVQIIAPA
jgi:UDP-N-acetylmuramate dehydrogenase